MSAVSNTKQVDKAENQPQRRTLTLFNFKELASLRKQDAAAAAREADDSRKTRDKKHR